MLNTYVNQTLFGSCLLTLYNPHTNRSNIDNRRQQVESITRLVTWISFMHNNRLDAIQTYYGKLQTFLHMYNECQPNLHPIHVSVVVAAQDSALAWNLDYFPFVIVLDLSLPLYLRTPVP